MVGFLSFEFIDGFLSEEVKFKNGLALAVLPSEGYGRFVTGAGLNMEIEGVVWLLLPPPRFEKRPPPWVLGTSELDWKRLLPWGFGASVAGFGVSMLLNMPRMVSKVVRYLRSFLFGNFGKHQTWALLSFPLFLLHCQKDLRF